MSPRTSSPSTATTSGCTSGNALPVSISRVGLAWISPACWARFGQDPHFLTYVSCILLLYEHVIMLALEGFRDLSNYRGACMRTILGILFGPYRFPLLKEDAKALARVETLCNGIASAQVAAPAAAQRPTFALLPRACNVKRPHPALHVHGRAIITTTRKPGGFIKKRRWCKVYRSIPSYGARLHQIEARPWWLMQLRRL